MTLVRVCCPRLPATYEPHPLHAAERNWTETNCYVGHVDRGPARPGSRSGGRRRPFTLSTDFEGDQWTLFKFPAGGPADPVRDRGGRAVRLAAGHRPRGRAARPRPPAHRRGRRLVPARHGRASRTGPTTQKTTIVPADARPGGSGGSATSTTPATSSSTGDDFDGLLPPAGPATRRGPAALRRGGPARPHAPRRPTSVLDGGASRSPAEHLAPPARHQPHAPLRCTARATTCRGWPPRRWRRSIATPSARAASAGPTPRWPPPSSTGSTHATAAGSSRAAMLHGDRRHGQGARVLVGPGRPGPHRRPGRPFDAMAAAWDGAMDGLVERYGA